MFIKMNNEDLQHWLEGERVGDVKIGGGIVNAFHCPAFNALSEI